jgi:uncharacterized membrane protein YciS (DUF1049 family)
MNNIITLNSAEINSIAGGNNDGHVVFNHLMANHGGEFCYCRDCVTYRNEIALASAIGGVIAANPVTCLIIAGVVTGIVIGAGVVYYLDSTNHQQNSF